MKSLSESTIIVLQYSILLFITSLFLFLPAEPSTAAWPKTGAFLRRLLTPHICFHSRIDDFELALDASRSGNTLSAALFDRHIGHFFFFVLFQSCLVVNTSYLRRLFTISNVILCKNTFRLFSCLSFPL